MAGEIIRDVVIRIRLDQIDTKLKVPDYAPVNKALKQWEKTAVGTSEKIQGSFEKVGKAVGDNAKKHEEVGRKAEEAARKIVDGNLKVADSAKLAGEGIFTLGRGIAFLGASSSDSFQESLKTIAKFQGAFDVFKGGTDFIKGTVDVSGAKLPSFELRRTTKTKPIYTRNCGMPSEHICRRACNRRRCCEISPC